LDFFYQKTTSFIQLFDEVDLGHKGYLDVTDISNLLQNGNIDDYDYYNSEYLMKQFNDFDSGTKVTFQQFLKQLTP
jgi:Ca2+-binding EF-hand superfamily protein